MRARAVHRVFASCGQEAFFEGHVHALRTLGAMCRFGVSGWMSVTVCQTRWCC